MTKDEMASESRRMEKEKIEQANLFKAKSVGEIQVRVSHELVHHLSIMTCGTACNPRQTHQWLITNARF